VSSVPEPLINVGAFLDRLTGLWCYDGLKVDRTQGIVGPTLQTNRPDQEYWSTVIKDKNILYDSYKMGYYPRPS